MRETALDVARKVAATEKYKEGSSGIDFERMGSLANAKFSDWVFVPPIRLSYLMPHVLAAGYQESDIDDILQESWSAAWSEGAVRKYEDKLNLPLCLLNLDKADAALVVELQESGVYQGMTILTMEMAYKDARLICRPDSDWLNTAVI